MTYRKLVDSTQDILTEISNCYIIKIIVRKKNLLFLNKFLTFY